MVDASFLIRAKGFKWNCTTVSVYIWNGAHSHLDWLNMLRCQDNIWSRLCVHLNVVGRLIECCGSVMAVVKTQLWFLNGLLEEKRFVILPNLLQVCSRVLAKIIGGNFFTLLNLGHRWTFCVACWRRHQSNMVLICYWFVLLLNLVKRWHGNCIQRLCLTQLRLNREILKVLLGLLTLKFHYRLLSFHQNTWYIIVRSRHYFLRVRIVW